MYGIANTKNEFVIFLGKSSIQFKIVNKRLKIRKYDSDNTQLYVDKMYNPYWEILLTIYK